MEINVPVEATIEAMVFKARPKPKYIPRFIWRIIRWIEMRLKRKKGITGGWKDQGVISYTKTEIK